MKIGFLIFLMLVGKYSSALGEEVRTLVKNKVGLSNEDYYGSISRKASKGDRKALLKLYEMSLNDKYGSAYEDYSTYDICNLLYSNPFFWIKTLSTVKEFKWKGLCGDGNIPKGVEWNDFCIKVIKNLKSFHGTKKEMAFTKSVYEIIKNQFSSDQDFWKKIN